MYSTKHLQEAFQRSVETKLIAQHELSQKIMNAGSLLVNSLRNGGKILSCGNGGSACDAMHFAAELLNRFQFDRPSLPAVALTADSATITAIANDYGYEEIFAKQISSLANQNDALLAISTSGNSANVISAIKMAHKKGIRILALTGKDGGKISNILHENDIELRAPSTATTPRIQELHILLIHCLCDYIEKTMFTEE
ncbi:MAG: SIS domain-containing protein [Gammaproteobacteria bacterium]|nr:SIS domain-containing protein [Gammaproteobacteria bacterium]